MSDIRGLLFNKDTRKLEVLTTQVKRLDLSLKTSLLQAPIEQIGRAHV